jgi:hypothetical protein
MTVYPVGYYNGAILKKTKEEKKMNWERIVQVGAANRTRQEIKAQLAQYLAQQPESKQAFHRWMKVLEIAGLAIIAGAFAVAMYVSINHTAVAGTTIAAAWFAFPVSAVPLMILQGLHTIVLRASLPSVLTGRPKKFVTGSKAVWSAWGLIATALAVGAFWGTLAWAVWSFDMALIESYARILGTVMGVLIPASIIVGLISGLYKQFARLR